MRNAEALIKEALGAIRHLLGQDSALAHNYSISHNTLWCFLSFDDLTPILTTHTHTIIPAPEENPSRVMT